MYPHPYPSRGKGFLSSPKYPDRLWGPPSLLFNPYRGQSRRESSRGFMLTTYLHIAPRLRMSGSTPLPPPPYPPATPWCGEGQIFYFYTNKKSGININQIPRLMADFCIRHSYNKFGSEIFRWTNSSPPSQLCVCLILYISCPALRY